MSPRAPALPVGARSPRVRRSGSSISSQMRSRGLSDSAVPGRRAAACRAAPASGRTPSAHLEAAKADRAARGLDQPDDAAADRGLARPASRRRGPASRPRGCENETSLTAWTTACDPAIGKCLTRFVDVQQRAHGAPLHRKVTADELRAGRPPAQRWLLAAAATLRAAGSGRQRAADRARRAVACGA